MYIFKNFFKISYIGRVNIMKRKILIFLCFILCIVSIAGVSATDEITEINNNAGDSTGASLDDTDVSLDNAGDSTGASLDDVVSLDSQQNYSSNLKEESGNNDLIGNESLKLTRINAPSLTMYYKDGRSFSGYLTDIDGVPLAGMPISLKTNYMTYNRITDENGRFSLAINLSPGIYPIQLKFNGSPGYLPTENISYVAVKNTIYSFIFTKMYGDTLKFIVLVSQNVTLENIKLSFNINGRIYYRTTGILGTASLPINLPPGNYIITIERLDTHEKASNPVIVHSHFSENEDLNMFYKNGSAYTVQLNKKHDKPAGAGEVVTFNINGILYNRKTDSSGHAKLNINLPPGKYIVTAEYMGDKVSNTIVVKPVITASDLTKVYGTPDPFVAKLVDGQGRPYSGKTVTFNINGVIYAKTTDSEGLAKLNIALMPGEYIITSTSPNGNSISNKITVTDANRTAKQI